MFILFQIMNIFMGLVNDNNPENINFHNFVHLIFPVYNHREMQAHEGFQGLKDPKAIK